MPSRLLTSILVCAIVGAAGARSFGQASFTALGYLPGYPGYSQALGVSADGSVVAGYSGSGNQQAFRWTRASGMQPIPNLTGYTSSAAYGISGDGSAVVGMMGGGSGRPVAFSWTAGGGSAPLGWLSNDPVTRTSQALAANFDGSVVVGHGVAPAGDVAFRWTSSGGMQPLTNQSGQPVIGVAFGVSHDGSVVVGRQDLVGHAFRWTGGVVQDLGVPPGCSGSEAYAVSADGTTVVGEGLASTITAFRWTAGTGIQNLPLFPGAQWMHATGVNADGSVVVGFAGVGSGHDGFVWTASGGTRSLRGILTDNGINLPSDWTYLQPEAISADGTTIVGEVGTGGARQAFVVVVPAPSTAIIVALAALTAAGPRRRLRHRAD